ncbi:MAG TPA: hypothetical protein VEY92_05265, partial [Pseudoxanthomonas sp.]|nr:hypothetical protein [Pseudoxanthomonas sp.]
IDERVPAAAGGEYIHHAFGMITIAKESPDIYSILALSMFNRAVGGAQSLWTESMGLSEVSGTLRSSQDGYTAIERLCLATPKEAAIHDYAPADRAECRTYSISTPRAV